MQKQSAYSLKKRGYRIFSEHNTRTAAEAARETTEAPYALADMPVVPLASGAWALCVPR